MQNLPNPPQPISLPIRNAVTFEDRVSILLNKAGSTAENPIVGSRYLQYSDIANGTASQTKGAALTLRFGVADVSEVILNAVVSTIDSNGNATTFKDIKDKFVLSSTEYRAELFVGSTEDIPSGEDSTRVFIDIATNLGRRIRQQVYTRDALDSVVLANGASTNQSNPVNIVKYTVDPTNYTIPLSFFPLWNDEIGRQHGAKAVSLQNAIVKPYGGMKTVTVHSGSAGTLSTSPIMEETNIEDVASIVVTSSGNFDNQTLGFFFRSKAGSDHGILVKAYLSFFVCESEEQDVDVPPDISNGLVGDFGTDGVINLDAAGSSTGTANSSIKLDFKGYRGHIDHASSGLTRDIQPAGDTTLTLNATTDFPYSFSTNFSSPDSLGVAFTGATMVVVEARNANETIIGNSLVFRKPTPNPEHGDPAPPTIASASYDFSTNVLTYNLTDHGNDSGEDTTLYLKPLYAVAKTSSPLTPDMTIDESTAIFTPKGSGLGQQTHSSGFSPTPDAVVFWAQSSSNTWAGITGAKIDDEGNHFFLNSPPASPESFYTIPTISSIIQTTSLGQPAYRITFSDRGGRTSSDRFSVKSRVATSAFTDGNVTLSSEVTSANLAYPSTDTGTVIFQNSNAGNQTNRSYHILELVALEGSVLYVLEDPAGS